MSAAARSRPPRSGSFAFAAASLLVAVACASCSRRASRDRAAAPAPDVPAPRWVGPVDVAPGAAPALGWSGTGLVVRASGADVEVDVRNEGAHEPIFVQLAVDGRPTERPGVPAGAASTLRIDVPRDGRPHVVELLRDTERELGLLRVLGVRGAEPLAPGPAPRTLVVVGDSMGAGYGALGEEHHPGGAPDPNGCRFSTATESATVAYPALVARALDAEAFTFAVSGRGVVRNRDHGTTGTMAAVLDAVPTSGVRPPPTEVFAVVVNLGTNDVTPPPPSDPGPDLERAYAALLATLRERYPAAWQLAVVGPMASDGYPPDAPARPTLIARLGAAVEARRRSGDARVSLLELPTEDVEVTGCEYHPGRAAHAAAAAAIARELSARTNVR